MSSQDYQLNGKFQYNILFSKFDGWDYKFPVLDPIRINKISDRVNSESYSRATNGLWLDVNITLNQRAGYYGWDPEDNFILHMSPNHHITNDPYAYVGRFSYEPESTEFLMGRLDQKHAATINQFGSHVFNEYVRGIYLKDQNLILLRPYFNPLDEKGNFDDFKEYDPELDQDKTDKTLEMLVKNNLPQETTIITRVNNEVVKRFEPFNV